MSTQVVNRQLTYLFMCSFAILFVGMGLFPLLPLYAGQFGATSTAVGIYLALTYVSISSGTMLTGWLAARLTRKGAFVAAGVLGIPALALMGQATALWQVVILTGTIWFCGGVGLALVSVFTGLYADKNSRGKSFGLLSLASPLAAIVGGMAAGRLVEWGGYPLMFVVQAVVWAAWPVIGMLKVKDRPDVLSAPTTAQEDVTPRRLGGTFRQLLLATLLSAMTISIGRMGLSLSMKAQQFSPGAITDATVVGGLVTVPVAWWLGVLSDRLGRKRFLVLGYLVAAAAVLTLSAAHQMWHFWLASAMLLVARSTNGSVASALATDLLAPQALGRGLSRLHSMSWIAGVLGFAGAGYVIDALGISNLFLGAATLAVLAASLLGLLPGEGQAVSRERRSGQGISLLPRPETTS